MFRFIFPIILIIVAGVGSSFLIGPIFNDSREIDPQTERVISGGIMSLLDEIEAVEEALENAELLQDRMNSLDSRYQSIPAVSLASIESMIPNHPRTILLYPELIRISEESGLLLRNMSIAGGGDSQAGEMQTIDISFTSSGSYPQLLSFLDDLASNMRIMDINSLNISPATEGDVVGDIYNYSFNIKAYWLAN